MEFSLEVQFLIDQSIRRGLANRSEIDRIHEQHGPYIAEAVVERLNNAGVQFTDALDSIITARTNVLLNDLTLVELVSLCLQLPVVQRTPRRLYRHALKRRSYELDLRRLEYLDIDREWYYLAPSFNSLQRSIRRLFESGEIPFARDWQEARNRADLSYLKGLVAHPAFVAEILPQIRGHYLDLGPVKLLMNWIVTTGQQMPAMADIIRAGLAQDGDEMVRWVLLSNRPSTAVSALVSRQDVCFSCPPQRRCQPLRECADPYRVLMAYRSATLDVLLASRHPGKSLSDCLVEDGLIAKFFLPYSIVVSAKEWMLRLSILDQSQVLNKSHGRYCPELDFWPCHETSKRQISI